MGGSFDQEVGAGRNKAWEDEKNGGVLEAWQIKGRSPAFQTGYLKEREEIFRQMLQASENNYSYHNNEY